MNELQGRTKGLDRTRLAAGKLNFDSIPIVDIGGLFDGGLKRRREIAAEIGAACERVGFLYVTNHGVTEQRITDVYDVASRFFSLPLEEKLRVDIHKAGWLRGYVPVGRLHADPHNYGSYDLQEGYEVSLELPEDDPDHLAGNVMYGPNVWPEAPADFRSKIYAYHQEMVALSARLLRCFALALDLPEHWFDDKITKPMAQLRVIYYPPQEGRIEPTRLGVGAHTDYECFTILAQSNAGLQVQNRAGEWIEAPPIPGSFVINIGDCMQRWTNDRFASTVHRVINSSGRPRYSLPFFLGANYDVVVECLPSCRGPGNPAKYRPVTAGEWTTSNIRAAYDLNRKSP